jgi:hypothetical protein
MKLIDALSRQLVKRLHRCGIGGYMRVKLATPWVNMEATLERIHVDDLNPTAVRAFLDLLDGGVTEVESYSDAVMTRYFGEYSSMAKSFLISCGSNEAFKEFAGLCAQWMLLQSNPTAVTKVRGSLIIASWENRHLDWATIMSNALVREVTANRKNRATTLAYWLGMFCPPPPGMERPSSRQKETTAQVAPEEDNARRPAQGQAAPEEAEAGQPQAPARRQAPVAVTTDRVCDPTKGKWPEEVPPTEKEEEKEKKKKKRS